MRRKIALALVVSTLIPVPQTTVAAWTAQVVDESGSLQPNVPVTEVWQNYTLEQTIHRESRSTGAAGRVSFPRRFLWRPLILNVIGTFRNQHHGSASYLDVTAPGLQSFTDLCCNSRLILRPIPQLPAATTPPASIP